ncbi:MAG: SDR family NAD(P)-dependent oxidoreductase [Bacteroidia bacterium]|nr:SDR family NAD(P)-dependent oxidoreductase [Bacteroidia bacterium]
MKRATQFLLAGLAARYLYRKYQEARYTFHGKVAIITGGSRGLGLVMARQLAEQGAKLALFARDAHELERAKADLVVTTPPYPDHRRRCV